MRMCVRMPATLLAVGVAVLSTQQARAGEGGVSFWLPGLFGSLAALPGQPGFAWTTLYYHTSVGAGGDKVFVRGGRFEAGIEGRGNAVGFGPTYVFATPVFGAQASVSILGIAGHMDASIDATLTGPRGNAISGTQSDERAMFGDLYPMVNLKWNHGVHNFMWYATGDIPVGAYNPNRLANLGIGHGAINSGFGYTYFNPHTGWEASAVLGFTYNFKNPDTDYKNGIDGHLDWGVSRFLTPQIHVGVVGYLFQQVTGDSGWRDARRLQVAHRRHRSADRLHLSGRRRAGLPEPQGLRGVCRREPARGLERVADVRALAGAAVTQRRASADQEVGGRAPRGAAPRSKSLRLQKKI